MTADDMTAAGAAGKPVVIEHNGRAWANSRNVAAFFGKHHGHVMRAIRSLLGAEPVLSQSNFGLAEYVDDQGKRRPTYDMDRDGFTLLAMGFTGAQALKFKLAYIDAFNRMEATLRSARENDDLLPPPDRREFPDWSLEELRAKRGTADLYRHVYGLPSAQWIMVQLGFPVPPQHLSDLRQMDLFSAPQTETSAAA